MSAQNALEKLNIRMHEASPCLLKNISTQPVFGRGSHEARIMFIGEAPGKNEDLFGKPFVGASGKILDVLLDSIELKRSDIYITNIVKYRPPENRDPTSSEIRENWPWLASEISLINPELIIPLGRLALSRFKPDAKISLEHGKHFDAEVLDLGLRSYYPLYHPAAALYNGSLRETLFEDFARIPDLLERTSL